MHGNQRRFGRIILGSAVVILLISGGIGYSICRTQSSRSEHSPSVHANDDTARETIQTNGSSCATGRPGVFTADVTDMDGISLIQNPIRLVGDANIKTHSFIEVSRRSPVYAPMNAQLTGGANYYETQDSPPVSKVQYLLSFNDGCEVSFWLDHIVDVSENIRSAFPAEAGNDTRSVPVTKTSVAAGELLGYSNQEGRGRFDFGTINRKGPGTSLTTNPAFADNPLVQTSDKYRYAVCPYDFYSASAAQKYRHLYDLSVSSDQAIIDNICH